jgi:hypothetical protein
MADHLRALATRLETDPFFLACPLRHYAKGEGLSDHELAAHLNCSEEVLLPVRLCRAPAAQSESFYADIERIAVKFSLDADALAKAVRQGQAIVEMSQGGESLPALLAARDHKAEKDAKGRNRP